MLATAMDGTTVANRILNETRDRAAKFERSHGRKPCLATMLVGDEPASHTYVRMKANRCRTTGLDSQGHHLPQAASTTQSVELVTRLAQKDAVDVILVQHPLPPQIDERQVFEAITPDKDVDGVTTYASFSAMGLVGKGFQSCTPAGSMRLLDYLRCRSHRSTRRRGWPQPHRGQIGRDAAAGPAKARTAVVFRLLRSGF